MFLEGNPEVLEGGVIQKFLNVSLCCHQLVMERTWFTNPTYTPAEGARIAAVFPFKEVMDLLESDFCRRSCERIAAAGTGGAIHQVSLR
jgi:hypothetical protein